MEEATWRCTHGWLRGEQCEICQAQPAQEWSWVCNECGSKEFTSVLSEADLEYLACAGCGCNEFHKEALAQPAQEQCKQVGTIGHIGNGKTTLSASILSALQAAPPAAQRPWVGLTIYEVDEAFDESIKMRPKEASNAETRRLFVQVIEAKLKEKNFD
jgi:predicted  nucleic acid-binding Zn-ribbon protein